MIASRDKAKSTAPLTAMTTPNCANGIVGVKLCVRGVLACSSERCRDREARIVAKSLVRRAPFAVYRVARSIKLRSYSFLT